MQKFVEYLYPSGPFSSKEEKRDVRTVDEFNIQTVHVPTNAVGFVFFRAKSAEHAARRKLHSKPAYYLAKQEQIILTADLRQRGYLWDAWTHQANMILKKGRTKKNIFKALTDPIDDKKAKELQKTNETINNLTNSRAESFGNFIANNTADMMEENGCHRMIGTWPGTCIGIKDKDTILDPDTRTLLSPPYIA
jgi:hypothetical protein